MKIKLIAEIDALIQLSYNTDFVKGRLLKFILKNTSDIILIIDEDELNELWNDSESDIRKFCDSYDIPRPKGDSKIKQNYLDLNFCYSYDPYAIWLFNRPNDVLSKFRNYLGQWAISPKELTDDFFRLEYSKEYDRDDLIDGPKDNGWGNYLAQIPKDLPPMNSIVINDRYLLLNTNEGTAVWKGFYGLHNLKALLGELLPYDLKIPFHLLILCQHPNLNHNDTEDLVDDFINDVKHLRNYPIIVEFVYSKSRHRRGLYSNYFMFDVERAFNAFYVYNLKQLSGENDFGIESYLNNPDALGDTKYDSARSKIAKIKKECIKVRRNPDLDPEYFSEIVEAHTDCDDLFYNRLFFSNIMQLNCTDND